METKELTGNKGEWSEIYTLFRLLGEGKIHAGDANMNKLSLYYPIINIIREEALRYEYKPDTQSNIVVIDEDGTEYARISMAKFMQESIDLLQSIKAAKSAAFKVPSSEAFMHEIGCTKLKAPSKDKADIQIVIHDLRTNMTQLLGFSIKSQLGNPSTLLNAGDPTNITYEICGGAMTDEQISKFNSIPGHFPRIKAIYDAGYSLKYHDIEHDIFKNNLLFLDSNMPQFIADCLLLNNTPDNISAIKDTVEKIAQKNPLAYTGKNVSAFYEHKMKTLLLDSALGMTPAKEWTGRYDANGGYIVVRKDGEIICYHFYNRNDVEDYLYNNTRFERASRSRYNFGSLYRGSDGNVYIKLNLQIRFIQ
jgi:type II restriction enzyme